jgi:hypothetical protein
MVEQSIEHCDKLGRPLAVGDCIAFPDHNELVIGTINKLNPKMVRVGRLHSATRYNKYSHDMVKLEGPDVTMYLLKNSK